MTEEQALLNAVLYDPEDDTPRLVYADYLEENGDPDRAWLIRAQIDPKFLSQDYKRGWFHRSATALSQTACENGDKWFHAMELAGYKRPKASEFKGPKRVPRKQQEVRGSVTLDIRLFLCRNGNRGHKYRRTYHLSHVMVHVRRGFIESVSGPLQWILDHGEWLITTQPLTHVVVADRDPDIGNQAFPTTPGTLPDDDAACWYVSNVPGGLDLEWADSVLPEWLYERVRRHPRAVNMFWDDTGVVFKDADDARLAVSDCVVDHLLESWKRSRKPTE